VQEKADLMAEFRQRPEGPERNIGRSFRSQILSYHDIFQNAIRSLAAEAS
jgi:hypothetical protein